jgi:hypothetical protein
MTMSEIKAGAPSAIIRLSSPVALLLAVLLAYGLYAVFVAGPDMRAVARERLSQAIAEETKAFCEKFGMRAGTAKFLECSDELAAIRQKQTERDRAADHGIL